MENVQMNSRGSSHVRCYLSPLPLTILVKDQSIKIFQQVTAVITVTSRQNEQTE